MRSRFGFIPVLALSLLTQVSPIHAGVKITAPCTEGEKWNLPADSKAPPADPRSQDESRQLEKIAAFFPEGANHGPVALLSEALFSRRISSRDSELANASDYALARALDRLNLTHAAHRTYQRIAVSRTPEFARAALVCLSRNLSRFPSLKLEKSEPIHNAAVDAILGLPAADATQRALGELALRSGLLSNPGNPEFSSRWLEAESHRSAWSQLARGISKVSAGDATAAVPALTQALGSSERDSLPEEYRDITRLTLARALSALGRHVEAEKQLHAISKASNFLPVALTEIAWQRLDSGRLREAAGAALSLQAGTLKRVFAPESLLVLSMALNELCRYPEAQQALNLLRKGYSESAGFFESNTLSALPLESVALQALRKKGTADTNDKLRIPRQLETELLASPVFQEAQREKKLWRDEIEALATIPERARQEQNALAAEIVKLSRDIKSELKAKTPDRNATRSKVVALRELLRTEKKFRESAPFGKALISKQRKDHATTLARLEKQVHKDLVTRLEEKKRLLAEVVEQASLVEIEVQQGGGKDIILTHARGEQNGLAAPRDRTPGGNQWNWGSRSTASLGDGEVWEDELGGFEADLVSRCTK